MDGMAINIIARTQVLVAENKTNGYRFVSLVRAIVEENLWRRVEHPHMKGSFHKWERFPDFVENRSPYGLGLSYDVMKYACKSDKKLTGKLNELDVREVREYGTNRHTSKARGRNTASTRDTHSDSSDHIRGRLKRDGHTDLLDQVNAGVISAHKAAVQVGYRKARFTVTMPVTSIAKKLRKELTPEQLNELIELLKT